LQYCVKCGVELNENTKFYPLLRNLESPRHSRRDKKSKTRDEENRMGGVTNLLVIPFSVHCVTDCEL